MTVCLALTAVGRRPFHTKVLECLERLVSEMTYYVSSGMLHPTHSLTHWSADRLSNAHSDIVHSDK